MFDILLLHLCANFPVDDGAAESIENGAKIVESTGNIEISEVDMPMLMGLQRLLETSTFEGIGRLSSSHQTGLTEDLVGRRGANGDDIFIEHHVSQAPIAHLGMLWRITEEQSTVPGDAERDEDARARVGVRSLLSPVQMEDPERKWPVDFCHRSIKEFFLARAIHRALIEDPEKAEKLMAEIRLNHEILDFAAGILRMDEDNDFVQPLTAMARQTSAHAPKSIFLGANAVTLLYRLTGRLEDNDWSKLRLDGADLTGADLSHKNFSGASLRHVQLDNANLAYADFRDCDLTGVRLEETVPVSALALFPEKRKILAAYGDRSLREWDLSHPSKNRVETKLTDMGMVPDWLEVMGSGGVNASMKNRVAYFDYSDPGTLKQKASFRTPVNLYRFVPEKHALMTLTETREEGFTASTIDLEHGVQLHSYTIRDVHLCVPLGKKGFAFYHEGYGIRIFMEDQASADYAIDTRGVSVLRAKAGREEHYTLAGGYHNGKVSIWKVSHGPKKIDVEPIFAAKINMILEPVSA